jgi:hypothetical protein
MIEALRMPKISGVAPTIDHEDQVLVVGIMSGRPVLFTSLDMHFRFTKNLRKSLVLAWRRIQFWKEEDLMGLEGIIEKPLRYGIRSLQVSVLEPENPSAECGTEWFNLNRHPEYPFHHQHKILCEHHINEAGVFRVNPHATPATQMGLAQ